MIIYYSCFLLVSSLIFITYSLWCKKCLHNTTLPHQTPHHNALLHTTTRPPIINNRTVWPICRLHPSHDTPPPISTNNILPDLPFLIPSPDKHDHTLHCLHLPPTHHLCLTPPPRPYHVTHTPFNNKYTST